MKKTALSRSMRQTTIWSVPLRLVARQYCAREQKSGHAQVLEEVEDSLGSGVSTGKRNRAGGTHKELHPDQWRSSRKELCSSVSRLLEARLGRRTHGS